MKAILCKRHGPPESLVVEEVADPVPGPGQLLIETRAIGVNFPDTLIIQNLYQFKPPLPFSPGSECAGIVTAVGAGVTQFKPGQRVAAFTTWGAYAQRVVAEAAKTMLLPDDLAFDTAAAFTLVYGTSYHALKDRAALRAGETLLVLGAAGGVGLAAVEIGKALGARVIAAASSADKLEVCRRHGADDCINYDTENLRERIKELTGGAGVDVVYDPVGGAYSEAALRSVGWRGRFLVVGFANGTIPSIALNLALLKGLSIVGVFWGEFTKREPAHAAQDMKDMMALLQAGKLKPEVSARYPFERVAEALNSVLARKAVGKIVLVP
jgi:NADPH:quinone reductase